MGYIELRHVTYSYPLTDSPAIVDVDVTLEKDVFTP